MADALSTQVGGGHYKGLAIQPIQLSMANNYDACIHSSIKYVTRHKDKAGAEDLGKGAHFCQLRRECMIETGYPEKAIERIPIYRYIELNRIPEAEGRIIIELHSWAMCPPTVTPDHFAYTCSRIVNMINALSTLQYGHRRNSHA